MSEPISETPLTFDSIIRNVLNEWEKKTTIEEDTFSTPRYSPLGLSQITLESAIKELNISHVFLHGLVSYALKRESLNCVHISFIYTRITPIDQPLIIPSKPECKTLSKFIGFAFSKLRHSGRLLATRDNGFERKDVFISIGDMQISSSLTSNSVIAVDKVQGCLLDYICDNSLNNEFIINELKSTQEIYRTIAIHATKNGELN